MPASSPGAVAERRLAAFPRRTLPRPDGGRDRRCGNGELLMEKASPNMSAGMASSMIKKTASSASADAWGKGRRVRVSGGGGDSSE